MRTNICYNKHQLLQQKHSNIVDTKEVDNIQEFSWLSLVTDNVTDANKSAVNPSKNNLCKNPFQNLIKMVFYVNFFLMERQLLIHIGDVNCE